MLAVLWKGKAISVNRWHMLRDKKIFASPEYEKFIESLAWTIRAEIKGLRCSSLSVTIDSKINPYLDHQNLLKPICDAIQLSGLLADDKKIKNIWMQEPQRHKKGELDEIWLYFTQLESQDG